MEAIPDSYGDLHSGGQKATVYYWVDPDTGAALYHTEMNDQAVVPFFPDVDSAERYLEQCAEAGDRDEYANYSLYQARTRKIRGCRGRVDRPERDCGLSRR